MDLNQEYVKNEATPIHQSNDPQRVIRYLMSRKVLNRIVLSNNSKCNNRKMKLRVRDLKGKYYFKTISLIF